MHYKSYHSTQKGKGAVKHDKLIPNLKISLRAL